MKGRRSERGKQFNINNQFIAKRRKHLKCIDAFNFSCFSRAHIVGNCSCCYSLVERNYSKTPAQVCASRRLGIIMHGHLPLAFQLFFHLCQRCSEGDNVWEFPVSGSHIISLPDLSVTLKEGSFFNIITNISAHFARGKAFNKSFGFILGKYRNPTSHYQIIPCRLAISSIGSVVR